MDTSNDHGSVTLDFLLGNGIRMPVPTDQDLARLLFTEAKELHAYGILASMIGNHPLDSVENFVFGQGVRSNKQISELYIQKVRAYEILTAYRKESSEQSSQIRSHFFIACSQKKVYWLLVEDSSVWNATTSGRYRYTVLDVDAMADCFADHAQYANPIGSQIMENLMKLLGKEIGARQEKLNRMNESFVSLKIKNQRIQSALTIPRTQGTGIEE